MRNQSGPHIYANTSTCWRMCRSETTKLDCLGNLEYAERLERLQLPSLAYRRLRGDMIELFKHFHTYDKRTLSPNFQPRERSTRRHEFQLLDRKPKGGIRGIQSNSFFYRSTKTWNDLPRHIVNAKHINSFKTRIGKTKYTTYDQTITTTINFSSDSKRLGA